MGFDERKYNKQGFLTAAVFTLAALGSYAGGIAYDVHHGGEVPGKPNVGIVMGAVGTMAGGVGMLATGAAWLASPRGRKPEDNSPAL